MEVCPLSRGVMSQPLSAPITGAAFAFSILLYPHSPSASLMVGFPAQNRREYGLTTFRVNQRCALGSASPPAVILSMCPHCGRGQPTALPFWFRLISSFSLFSFNDVYQRFTLH